MSRRSQGGGGGHDIRDMGVEKADSYKTSDTFLEVTDSCKTSDSDEENDEDEEETVDVPPIEIQQDMWGASIGMLMRDAKFVAMSKGASGKRYVRMFSTLVLLFTCISTQTFLLCKLKQFVTAKAVHDIRYAYDQFELVMYDEYTMTVNGMHRGAVGATFHSERFGNLTASQQQNACRIPLSQPDFFFVILSIWTLTCLQQLKQVKEDFQSLILYTNRCHSMKDSQTDIDGDAGDEILISALTLHVKAAIVVLVLVPRTIITCLLLWLGCRWLLATNNFADLVLNAVALEFIVLLKDSLYLALMSQRNKVDLGNTKIMSPVQKEKASIWVFTGSMSWMFLAFAWVAVYMGIPHGTEGLQTVLPHYKWDVQHVCVGWLRWRYCVDPPCPSSPILV